MVKSVVNNWAQSQDNQVIDGEAWSVWSNDIKLVSNLDSKLYEIFHSKVIEEYCIKKHKFSEHQASNIYWEALKKAMKAVPLAKRTFITKHATGMCGVGKFMKLWRERDTDACPQYGAPENASHIWICPQPQATDVCGLSLQKLNAWMLDRNFTRC